MKTVPARLLALGLELLPGLIAAAPATPAVQPGLRPPSIPLVAHDPYFSLWCSADTLTGATTTHWTGKPQALRSLARIDGQAFRLLGADPADVPALPQKSLAVEPTRTVATLGDARIEIVFEFLTPALPDDLAVLARPLTYLRWTVHPLDGRDHSVQIYFDAGPELAVNQPAQAVVAERADQPGLNVVRAGTVAQRVLQRQGDDVRIDWGYAYLAVPSVPAMGGAAARVAAGPVARAHFLGTGRLPEKDEAAAPRPAADAPVLAAAFDCGKVGSLGESRWLMLAYDDVRSIRYFEAELVGYWRRGGMDFPELLATAAREYDSLRERCLAFDRRLLGDLLRSGSRSYALVAALAYRQTLAGCKLVADRRGQPLLFPKENHSNGCIATVDVIYPMAPFTLLLSPALTKAMLVPILDYAASPRWKFDFAPHDLGRYPHAIGQAYGGGELTLDRQMMVEESANMILVMAALARVEGNADFAVPYWKQLQTWADYLRQKGFDPENQLCTDDFAGHLSHNVNLSAKAIVALGAFGQLATQRGETDTGRSFRTLAQGLAARWVREAADGDHTRLAFDLPGTWSQKYNLVWDRLLRLGLFPAEVLRRELDFYRRIQGPYGLPLDNRSTYTKLDWICWTASLTGDPADFQALTDPILAFLNATPDRSPMTDWYFTDTAKKRGFTARPVIGGVFVRMLDQLDTWRQWAGAGANTRGPWAPLPLRTVRVLVPTSEAAPLDWKLAPSAPSGDWQSLAYDDRTWQTVATPVGLARANTAGQPVRTAVKDPQLWLRRAFDWTPSALQDPHLRLASTGEVSVWINGVPAGDFDSGTRGYLHVPLPPAARRALQPGRNVIALHCKHPNGTPVRNEALDVGIVDLAP